MAGKIDLSKDLKAASKSAEEYAKAQLKAAKATEQNTDITKKQKVVAR